MNKRQNKKKLKYIIDNIQIVNLKENEFLLFRYNKNTDYKTMSEFANYINRFLSKKAIFVPTEFEVKKIIQ